MGKPEERLGDSLDSFEPDLPTPRSRRISADPFGLGLALLGQATTRLLYDLDAYRRGTGRAAPEPGRHRARARAARQRPGARAADEDPAPRSATPTASAARSSSKGQAAGRPVTDGGPDVQHGGSAAAGRSSTTRARRSGEYEPFFTATHRFEFARAEGVSTVQFYDPPGRVIGTLQPNQTFEKVVFDAWSHQTWDANDTVLLDPRTDPDVGPFFSRVLAGRPGWKTWYEQRISGDRGEDERRAAQRTAVHAATPSMARFDTLGHPIANVAHNRLERDGRLIDEYPTTRTVRDVQGNQRWIGDPLNRVAARFDYDMSGKAVLQSSFEAGSRLALADVGGSTILIWNSRGFRLRHTYDRLRRPTGEYAAAAAGPECLVQYTVYGEAASSAEAHNLRGKNYLQFDGAGAVAQPRFDFKGNLLQSERRVTRQYRGTQAWDTVEQLVSASGQVDPDTGTLALCLDDLLDAERFTGRTAYDAYNRPIQVTAPDRTIATLSYNDAMLLDHVDVILPDGSTSPFVTSIEYNARGERTHVSYGNETHTRYELDPETFRLNRLITRRPDGLLQDYRHFFDPVGNVVVIRDHGRPTVFHGNAVVSPDTSYVYDALYQLLRADGREQAGQNENHERRDLEPEKGADHPHDRQAMRRYSENYHYDAAGNLLRLVHSASGGGWTRRCFYEEASELEPGQTSNRLSRSVVGDTARQYSYDPNGNTTAMPHLHELAWDYGDQFVQADLGGGCRAFYSYDTAGRRVRKTIEQAGGRRIAERIYVGAFEVYRRYDGDGDTCLLERNTGHVYDNENRVALIETTTIKEGSTLERPPVEFRYQLTSGAKSVTIETDAEGRLITYEEYHPYGTTSYRAARGFAEVSPKRYRYAGKEHDEETGFYYYGARYYAPWLARWTSCDPAGMVDGSNIYRYVKNNPVNFTDPTGQWEMPSWRTVAVVAAVVVVGTVVTVATAGAAGPLVVGAVASIGLTGTAATVATGVAVGAIAGAVGGAAAGAAGEATRQTVNSKALGLGNEEFSGTKILDEAAKQAKTGAAIGAAAGGIAALAAPAGAAAIGAAGKLAQRVAPNLAKGVATAARGIGSAATAVAEKSGLAALSEASKDIGVGAAKSLFQEGSAGANAVATFAETGSVADSLGAAPRPSAPEVPPAIAPPTDAVPDIAAEGTRRTVALDADALVKFRQPGVQGVLQPGDRLVATPNVVSELQNSVGIKDVENFLGTKGVEAVAAEPGASVPATFLRQQLDALAPGAVGNAGDALNLGEAGSIGADLFVTADQNTIGEAFGLGGSIFLPHSGGASLPFVVVK